MRPSADLATLAVEACFGAGARGVLIPGHDAASSYTRVGRPAAPDRAALGPDGCARYVVDVVDAVDALGGQQVRRGAEDLLIAHEVWLWRPHHVPRGQRARIRFALPPDVRVAAPWPRGEGADTFIVDDTCFRWRGVVALGRLAPREIVLEDGATVTLAVLSGARAATDDALAAWVRRAAETVATFFGRFPRRRLLVVVAPTTGGGVDPVRFGYVVRGGGAAVVLLLRASAPGEALGGDWVAIHELFHLGMPPIQRADAWMSEGVTMLYTELLRMRAGWLSPQAGWEALHAGFERGRRAGTGRDLAEESRLMHQTGSYRRVYWAGAAIALEADLALRARGESLDAALRGLAACCAEDARFWTGLEVAARLDAAAALPDGEAPFSALADRWLASSQFPDLSGAYRKLGLVPTPDGVRRDTEGSVLRRAVARD